VVFALQAKKEPPFHKNHKKNLPLQKTAVPLPRFLGKQFDIFFSVKPWRDG